MITIKIHRHNQDGDGDIGTCDERFFFFFSSPLMLDSQDSGQEVTSPLDRQEEESCL